MAPETLPLELAEFIEAFDIIAFMAG